MQLGVHDTHRYTPEIPAPFYPGMGLKLLALRFFPAIKLTVAHQVRMSLHLRSECEDKNHT